MLFSESSPFPHSFLCLRKPVHALVPRVRSHGSTTSPVALSDDIWEHKSSSEEHGPPLQWIPDVVVGRFP